jgi:hypothetical protein
MHAGVHAKKITAAFDGGRLTSNGGVMLLAMAERRLGWPTRYSTCHSFDHGIDQQNIRRHRLGGHRGIHHRLHTHPATTGWTASGTIQDGAVAST